MNTEPETTLKKGLFKSLWNLIVNVTSNAKKLFSFLGIVFVTIWAICELMGWWPKGHMDALFAFAIVLLTLVEFAKTNSNNHINKPAFIAGLVTGVIQFGAYCVVATILIKDGRFQFTQYTNVAMFIFVIVDVVLVPINSYSMGNRSVNMVSGDDHHGVGVVTTGEHNT
jgi:hypothetical protein